MIGKVNLFDAIVVHYRLRTLLTNPGKQSIKYPAFPPVKRPVFKGKRDVYSHDSGGRYAQDQTRGF